MPLQELLGIRKPCTAEGVEALAERSVLVSVSRMHRFEFHVIEWGYACAGAQTVNRTGVGSQS